MKAKTDKSSVTTTLTYGIYVPFFCSLYSCLNGCDKQNVEPFAPQRLLFMDAAEFSLAFPGSARLMIWWSYGVMLGRWLQLRSSHEEYFDERMVRTTG